MQSWFTFILDGETCRVEKADTHTTLAAYLSDLDGAFAHFRDHHAWNKSCLVVLGDIEEDCHRFRLVDAGLILLPMLAGRQVWTAEGIRNTEPDHPASLAVLGSSFECSQPRMDAVITAMFEGYYRPDLRRQGQTNDQFDSLMTRTANAPGIREAAVQVFASTEQLRHEAALKAERTGDEATVWNGRKDIFGDQFTKELFTIKQRSDVDFVDENKKRFFRPEGLVQLLKLIREYPEARLIAGGTAIPESQSEGVARDLISLESVRELNAIIITEESWEVGSGVSLTRLVEKAGRECPPIAKLMRRFGTRAIRNRATLGGYFAVAKPDGQLTPLLLALNARVILLSEEGERDAPISQFFDSMGGTILKKGEIIRSIIIPRFSESLLGARGISTRICDAYTTGLRRTLTNPYVSAAYAFELRDKKVVKAWIAYGGIGKAAIRARDVEQFITGKAWNEETVFEALPLLNKSVTVSVDGDDDETNEYRKQLVVTLFQKFFYQHPKPESVRPEHLTATGEFARLDEPFFDVLPG